jgi:hypothetical protein
MQAIGSGPLQVAKNTLGSGEVPGLRRGTMLRKEENGKRYVGARTGLKEEE